jgi:hypothetical protein
LALRFDGEEAPRHHGLVLAVHRDVAEPVGLLNEFAAAQHRKPIADHERAQIAIPRNKEVLGA